MHARVPRLTGAALRLLGRLVRSSNGGSLARTLVAQMVEPPLDAIDFSVEGEPAPLYQPPSFVRPRGGQ